MAFRKIFTVNRKTFLYPSAWINAEAISEQTSLIWSILGPLFRKPKPGREETFEAAVKRLKLSEADIESGIKSYRTYAWILLLFGFVLFAYGFVLLFAWGSFSGWLLAMACVAMALAQAFRFDFWSFQMQQRKLGLTFKDWKRSRLGDKGSSK